MEVSNFVLARPGTNSTLVAVFVSFRSRAPVSKLFLQLSEVYDCLSILTLRTEYCHRWHRETETKGETKRMWRLENTFGTLRTKSSNMALSVQSVGAADAPALARTMMAAMYTDPHWVFLWYEPDLEVITANCALRLPWNLCNGGKEKRHQIAVDNATGEVVGYARWLLPPALAEQGAWEEALPTLDGTSNEERKRWERNFKESTQGGWNTGLKSELSAFQSLPLEEAEARIMRCGPYLTLDYLTVSPDFQRRGVATMLVQSGLKIADAHGLKSYVMALPAALKLYINLGFRSVETVTRDYSQYGGTEPHIHHFLVRQPVPV